MVGDRELSRRRRTKAAGVSLTAAFFTALATVALPLQPARQSLIRSSHVLPPSRRASPIALDCGGPATT